MGHVSFTERVTERIILLSATCPPAMAPGMQTILMKPDGIIIRYMHQLMHGSGRSISPKEMRYVGVYLLEDGNEITLGADYPLSDIPMHEKGVLKHIKGRMVYFSVTAESCL